MAIIRREPKHKWNFESVGGTTRVKISTGKDIAHLAELDPKMWTVLSCPVKGLGIDDKTLAFIDWDGDGKIRISDVVEASKWVTSVLKNVNLLVKGEDSINIQGLPMVSLVVPCMSETIARSSPRRAFSKVLFPVFVAPAIATGIPFLMALPSLNESINLEI